MRLFRSGLTVAAGAVAALGAWSVPAGAATVTHSHSHSFSGYSVATPVVVGTTSVTLPNLYCTTLPATVTFGVTLSDSMSGLSTAGGISASCVHGHSKYQVAIEVDGVKLPPFPHVPHEPRYTPGMVVSIAVVALPSETFVTFQSPSIGTFFTDVLPSGAFDHASFGATATPGDALPLFGVVGFSSTDVNAGSLGGAGTVRASAIYAHGRVQVAPAGLSGDGTQFALEQYLPPPPPPPPPTPAPAPAATALR